MYGPILNRRRIMNQRLLYVLLAIKSISLVASDNETKKQPEHQAHPLTSEELVNALNEHRKQILSILELLSPQETSSLSVKQSLLTDKEELIVDESNLTSVRRRRTTARSNNKSEPGD